MTWRDPDDFHFNDGGEVELDYQGEIVRAVLVVDEDWDGKDEWPVARLTTADRQPFERSFFDADRWRPVVQEAASE